MSAEPVTAFVITIFNVSKHGKTSINDGIIEISHNKESYSFDLGSEQKQQSEHNERIFPQSASFYTHTLLDNNHMNNNDIITITLSRYNCFIKIPFKLYFDDKIIHEFVMTNTNSIKRNKSSLSSSNNLIDLIPPIITLSITSIIPLPYIITPRQHNTRHLMYQYINNNVSTPMYSLNLVENEIDNEIYNLISQFIDNSAEIVPTLNDNNSDSKNLWDKIKKYIKNKKQRHITLIAVFYKINELNNDNDIQKQNNKYIISHSTYKLLYRLLHKVLDYANPANINGTNGHSTNNSDQQTNSNKSIDVITFYLVLCIGRISYYQHQNRLNCLIDDLGYKQWMDIDAIYQLIDYLMLQHNNNRSDNYTISNDIQHRISYLKMICSFILIHQTENGHMMKKLDKLYFKLNLLKDIIDKIPQRLFPFHINISSDLEHSSLSIESNSNSNNNNEYIFNPELLSMRKYLFEWLLRPITNLLLTIDSQNNKKSMLTNILSTYSSSKYKNKQYNDPFGYLYGDPLFDNTYHSLLSKYYECIDRIHSKMSAPKMKPPPPPSLVDPNKSVHSPPITSSNKDMDESKISAAGSQESIINVSPNTSPNPNNNNNGTELFGIEVNNAQTMTGEAPMLKHYISNYAVIRSSITSQDTLSPNSNTVIQKLSGGIMNDEFDDGFYLLDRDRNKSLNTASINMDNSLLLALKAIDFPEYESGEKDEEKINKLLNITNGVSIKIPGLPLLPGMIKLTNYRIIFIPFQKGFVKYKGYRNYFEIPLGSIYNTTSTNIDNTDNENLLHQQLLSYNNNKKYKQSSNTPKAASPQNIASSSTKHLDIKSPSPLPLNGQISSSSSNGNSASPKTELRSGSRANLKPTSKRLFLYKHQLEIITKDGRRIKFLFSNTKQDKFNEFVREIRKKSFTKNLEETFAVKAGIKTPSKTISITKNDKSNESKIFDSGWNVYDFFKEFTRQKIPLQFGSKPKSKLKSNLWRISEINKSYKYCETYPKYFIVPASIDDKQLQEIKSSNSQSPFRSKSRIPVLSYYHDKNGETKGNGAVIMRSSQPMTGMGGLGGFVSTSWWSQNRCQQDEKLLNESCIKYIIDARPKMNAVVNQAAGGGYENTVDFYKGIRLIFGNIDNIHKVRISFDAINKAIYQSVNRHNHSLHIPHIKYLYIGHKYKDKIAKNDKSEKKEQSHDNNNNNNKNMNDTVDIYDEHEDEDFVISTNQPIAPELLLHNNDSLSFDDTEIDKLNYSHNKKHSQTHAQHHRSSSSAGELLKFGKSMAKFGKTMAKHAHTTIKNKKQNLNGIGIGKSRSLQTSPRDTHSNDKNNINGNKTKSKTENIATTTNSSESVTDHITPGGPMVDNNNHHNKNGDLYDSILNGDNFWNTFVSSSWFSYLKSIIVSTICIVSIIDCENKSVLIHCSDGWDRTSQLSALSQILLDPYFRTIEGLCCLIEKDWISFGHKFHERFGHTKDDINNDQRSPVFIQFLDCLHQIINQFPNQFEYNIDLLSYIAYHTTSCLYGTFLCDSERLRLQKYSLHTKSRSIWSDLLNQHFIKKHKFKNKNYQKCDSVLYIDHRSINLKVWDYYTKIDPFPIYNYHKYKDENLAINSNSNNNNNNNISKKDVELRQKEFEILKLKQEIESLKFKNNELQKVESQYNQIMKCIDTKNGFLLQDQVPIIPDLDYIALSSQNNTLSNSDDINNNHNNNNTMSIINDDDDE